MKFKVTFNDEFEAESEEGAYQQLRDYLESLCDTIGHLPIDIEAFEFEEVTPEALTESVLEDIRDTGDPARGNKGKDREKEFYFIDEPTDPETGRTSSKVVYKRSFANMVKDIEAEAIDMKKLSDENPDDMVIYKLAEELQDMFNTFRTHIRKNYPDEYKKI